jgi:hypothetical protein
MSQVKILNVEIADSEVYRLMQENYLGCYVRKHPALDKDIFEATGEYVFTAEVEVYKLSADGRRDDSGRIIQDIGSCGIQKDQNGKVFSKDIAIAKEIALTKARRRAVLCYLGKEYDYEEVIPKPEKPKR